MKLRFVIFAACLSLAPVHGFADEPALIYETLPGSPTAEEVRLQQHIRDSVTRSLTYLENAGVAWMNERGCFSCHHVPFMLWTHRSSKAHGIQIDADKLNQWEEWSRNNSLARRNQFKLSKEALDGADSPVLSAVIKEKLQLIVGQPFASENDFVKKLSEVLSEDELSAQQQSLKKIAALDLYSSERNGGGLDVLAQLVLGDYRPAQDDAAERFRKGLLDLIVQMQLDDGSWTPGSQFASMRQLSLAEANRTTTMWAAMALSADQSNNEHHAAHIERAISYLRLQSLDSKNREVMAVQVLLGNRLGRSGSKFNDQLIAAQNEDGGWSWNEGRSSDPYTTGLVLYALGRFRDHRSSKSKYEPLKQRAIELLLKAQQNDGTWLTASKDISNTTDPERLKARDEIYHYWGTAWAVLGLLEVLPEVELKQ